MRQIAKGFTFHEKGGTCSLSADQGHERISHGGDGDGKDFPQVVLGVVEILNKLVAGPGGAVPTVLTRKRHTNIFVSAFSLMPFDSSTLWPHQMAVNN